MRALSLLLALLCLPLASQANDQRRLQSIKQQALALYTLRLADQRQFSPSATILVGQRGQDVSLRQLRIAVDGQWRVDYSYHPHESSLLGRGAMQRLGLVDLASGPHDITVEMRWQADNGETRTSRSAQTLRLDSWPRGLSLTLSPDRKRQRASIEIQSPINGDGILRSARFEIAQGHALKALAQMQTLAHVDPALAATPPAQELLARSLQGWGLDNAAQATYSALANAPKTDQDRRIRARLAAAKLALEAKNTSADMQLGDKQTTRWPLAQKHQAQMLESQRLVAAGEVDAALKLLPGGGTALQRYNLAAALFTHNRTAAAKNILRQLAIGEPSHDELTARVQDLARLKLGYQHLADGQAQAADDILSRTRLHSPYINRALLGRGWSKLLPLALNGGHLQRVQDDGFRPRFVQAIDAALRGSPQATTSKALRDALSNWARLQDADPMDPAVQEAQAATAYALLKLGDYKRAVQYSEKVIGRLEAVRDNLKAGMRASRTGQAINGITLVRDQWPPAPAAWARRFVVGAWWQSDKDKPTIPENAYRARLISQPDTVRILDSMHMLNQVELLMDAVVEHPDLAHRATQLRKRIEAERAAQQKTLDRNVYYWMRQELDRATRYLIMARFSLAQAYAHQDAAAPAASPQGTQP